MDTGKEIPWTVQWTLGRDSMDIVLVSCDTEQIESVEFYSKNGLEMAIHW